MAFKNLYQKFEKEFLAPYAMRSFDSKGREFAEKENDLRTPFQKDRDRIVHCSAFRRLEYKTQVFVNHEGDHYRTRLTHSLETSQVARSIARSLRLNEDLVETIALAHDLGHGPFGHAGQFALQDLMKDHGGFEHNVQCLRIVEHLEDSYAEFPGLNLTYETREGLKKHPEYFYDDRRSRFRSLEGDVVDLADQIAYNSHDLDDGLRSALLTDEQVGELEIWRDACKYIRRKYPELPDFQRNRLVIRLIVSRCVKDAIAETEARLKRLRIKTVAGLQKRTTAVVSFSPEFRKQMLALKKFLHKNLYQHYRVIRMTDKGQRFLHSLFEVYLQKPQILPPYVVDRMKAEGVHRVICDYIAGMTDRFALDEYKRLFEPYERV